MLKILQPLTRKDFVPLFLSQIPNNLAFTLDYIVISAILVYSWGKGPYTLALFYAAYAGPTLLTPFIGALVDTWPLRKIMYISTLMSAILTFYVALSATPALLIFLVLVRAVVKCFYQPAETSMLKFIFPESELQRATSLVQLIFQFFLISGPIIGAFLISFMKSQKILYITAALYLISTFFLFMVDKKYDLIHKNKKTPLIEIFTELKFAFKYFLNTKNLKYGFIFLFISVVTYSMAESMIVLLAKAIGFSKDSFEWIFIAMGIGGIAAAVIIGEGKNYKKPLSIMNWGILICGLGFLISSGLCPNINYFSKELFVISWLLVGTGVTITGIMFNVTLIKASGPDIIGKTSSSINVCWGIGFLIFPPLGAVLSKFENITFPFILCGVFLILTSLFITLKLKE